MSALWTGIHSLWVHCGLRPPLPPKTYIEGRVLPPTTRPGTTGVTRPTTSRYSPCQAKMLTAPRHSTGQRCPLSSDPKVRPHLYTTKAASLLTQQLCRFEQVVHKESKPNQLNPE